jgi:hypothetical protein
VLVFSIPKPFVGEIGDLQRRAVNSWQAIADEVVLFGAYAEIAGVEHVEATVNERGTPFLDVAFREAARRAAGDAVCFVNADIILGEDLLRARDAVAHRFDRFLLVGQTRDLEVRQDEDVATLQRRALREGRFRGPTAIDWFVFPARLFEDMPAFLVGRASFDNWLIWRARRSGPVVDATAAVSAIHQKHDYAHLAGGSEEAYYGPEAQHNMSLTGGRRRIYTLHDASHRLTPSLEVRRNVGATFRARETIRKVQWKLGSR